MQNLVGGGGGRGGGFTQVYFFDKQTPEITVSSLFLSHFLEYVSRQNWLNTFCMVSFFLTHGDERIGRDTLGMSFGTQPSFITWPSFVPVSSYWGQDKNWPTADWPVPSNDSRNNCGTHLGSTSLLLSKMVNCTLIQQSLGNKYTQIARVHILLSR